MDFLVLSISFLGFVSFFLSHVVVFRLVDKGQEVKWLLASYFLGMILTFAITFFFLLETAGYKDVYGEDILFAIMAFAFMLYNLLVCVYILGVFGVVFSSLRIRLLQIVSEREEKGIDKHTLFSFYGKEKVVKERLQRLTASSDLAYQDGHYRVKKQFSVFYLHSLLHIVIKKLLHNNI